MKVSMRTHNNRIALLKIFVILAIPTALFFVVGNAMMEYTGRNQFDSNAPEAVPLNFRIAGYDLAHVIAYWDGLGMEGRIAEQRFLQADLFFPLLYGGSLLVSSLFVWSWLGRPFSRFWLFAPVIITVLTDWTENFIHLRQLERYLQGKTLASGWLEVASMATSIKIVFFSASAFLLVVLACWFLKASRATEGECTDVATKKALDNNSIERDE